MRGALWKCLNTLSALGGCLERSGRGKQSGGHLESTLRKVGRSMNVSESLFQAPECPHRLQTRAFVGPTPSVPSRMFLYTFNTLYGFDPDSLRL
jgi:hypothetical protein